MAFSHGQHSRHVNNRHQNQVPAIEYWFRRVAIERAARFPSPLHLAAIGEPFKIARRAEPCSRFSVISTGDEWNRDMPAVHPKGRSAKLPSGLCLRAARHAVAFFIGPLADWPHST
jgi:hypothetical protein